MTVPGLDPRIVVEISTPERLRRDSSTSLPSFDPQIHSRARRTIRASSRRVHGSLQFAENQAPPPVLLFGDEAPVAMNALESIVESSVDCRGGDNGVPLCPSPAVAPRNLKVVGGLHTAISSRLGRLIAAVIFLESTDITDKWAREVRLRSGAAQLSDHERKPIACASSGDMPVAKGASADRRASFKMHENRALRPAESGWEFRSISSRPDRHATASRNCRPKSPLNRLYSQPRQPRHPAAHNAPPKAQPKSAAGVRVAARAYVARQQLTTRINATCGSAPGPDAYRPVWISAIALSIASSIVRRI